MIHPDGLNSFDMGVWQEDDGSAFLVRSVNNEYVGISQLSPDYTATTGLVSTAPRVSCGLFLQKFYTVIGSQRHLFRASLNAGSFPRLASRVRTEYSAEDSLQPLPCLQHSEKPERFCCLRSARGPPSSSPARAATS